MFKFSVSSNTAHINTTFSKSKEGSNRAHMLKIIFVIMVPVAGLIVQNIILLSENIKLMTRLGQVEESVLFSLAINSVIHSIQVERGSMILYMNSRKRFADLGALSIEKQKTEMKFNSFYSKTVMPTFVANVRVIHSKLSTFRETIDNITEEEDVLRFYTDIIKELMGMMTAAIDSPESATLKRATMAQYLLAAGKDSMGIARASGVTALTQGSLSMMRYNGFCGILADGRASIRRSSSLSEIIMKKLVKDFANSTLDVVLNDFIKEIHLNNGTGSLEKAQTWFSNMTTYIDLLQSAELDTSNLILKITEDEKSSTSSSLAGSILLVSVSILLAPFVVILIVSMTSTLRNHANSFRNRSLQLKRERKKTEKLLYEILPVPVAEKLIKHETSKPEYYESATIYFSDIVGFTDICSESTPIEVVDMLNVVYKSFDERLELYDVYKVETIGDAYMVASGLPDRNGDAHSAELALTSLDLRDVVSKLKVPHMPEVELMLRIGLHTGSVVAGVVGSTMPRYCLFGDTVNTASRMESTGLAKHIQISETTYRSLKFTHGGFEFELRGEVEVKGKGRMLTYFLISKDEKVHPDR